MKLFANFSLLPKAVVLIFEVYLPNILPSNHRTSNQIQWLVQLFLRRRNYKNIPEHFAKLYQQVYTYPAFRRHKIHRCSDSKTKFFHSF